MAVDRSGHLVGRMLVVGALLLAVAACGGEQPRASDASASAEPVLSAVPTTIGPATPNADPAQAPLIAPAPQAPAAAAAPLLLPASQPVAVSVPAIGVNSPMVVLGRNADGTIEVPSLDDPDSRPGWYSGSPTPGLLGPAIILGHVDSRQFGPGVFYALQTLRPGDGIDVTRADGKVAQFTVDSVKSVAKSEFPTLEVYGNLDHSGLRLITCGGEFDPDARSYESNIIVFASLTGSRQA